MTKIEAEWDENNHSDKSSSTDAVRKTASKILIYGGATSTATGLVVRFVENYVNTGQHLHELTNNLEGWGAGSIIIGGYLAVTSFLSNHGPENKA